VIPAFAFLILKDTVATYYSADRGQRLAYVVVEPEELEAEEEVAETAAPVEETAAEAPVEAPETTEDITVTAEAEQDATPDPVVEAAPETETDPVVETAVVGVLSSDEMDAAARAARVCASCHQFERERNGAGPHLIGVGGRTIGAVDGFRYSNALMDLNAAGTAWTAEELEKWLAGPTNYAPGTKMNFVVQDAAERRLIAQWLMQKDQ